MDAPSTRSTFAMLLPTTFPTANEGDPESAASKLTKSSGKEVPIATKENPMKPPSQPNSFPIETAELTIQRGDKTVSTRPTLITMISRDTDQLYFLGE